MMSGSTRRAAWVCAATVALVASASAAGGRPQSVSERIDAAHRVVVARVEAVTSRWQENRQGDRIIISRVTMDVQETLKGPASTRLFMEVPGGSLDGFTLRVSSQRLPTPGERAVFFLDQQDGMTMVPHNGREGVLELGAHDVIKGSHVSLDDIRGLVRRRGGAR